nr:hypothetical protein GCM10020241_21210 [Streptoalloteichus tenebrarius]
MVASASAEGAEGFADSDAAEGDVLRSTSTKVVTPAATSTAAASARKIQAFRRLFGLLGSVGPLGPLGGGPADNASSPVLSFVVFTALFCPPLVVRAVGTRPSCRPSRLTVALGPKASTPVSAQTWWDRLGFWPCPF